MSGSNNDRTRTPIAAGLLAALLLPFASASAEAQDARRFDGKWATSVTCKSKDPAGAVYKFVTEVRDGTLSGIKGSEGERGFLRIEGRVTPEGIGRIYVTGRSANDETIAGREIPAGTEYRYYVEARFEGASGAGNRVEGRACAFKFDKR